MDILEVEEHTLGVVGLGPTPKFKFEKEKGLGLNYQKEDTFRLVFAVLKG